MENIEIFIIIANIFVSAAVGYGSAAFKIGEYRNKVDTLESTLGKDEHAGLRKTVGELNKQVVACETCLKERGPLGKRESPMALSERGVQFAKDSGSEKFIDDNFDELYKAVEKLDPKTAYDVQEDSKKVVEVLRDDERLNPLKEWLFKDGSTLEELFFVMSIYLRDKVLIKKDWNVKDIDKHEKNETKT